MNNDIKGMIATILQHDSKLNLVQPSVLQAMRQIDRKLFVPINQQKYAYEDRPLPIENQQTISQPYIVALMTSLLSVDKNSRILEIGTGSGYQSAVLSKLVKEVYTVEIIKELAVAAKKLFAKLNLNNIYCANHDGYLGWQEYAPFDGIIITAAVSSFPSVLLGQLKIEANMVIPLVELENNNMEQVLYVIKKDQYNHVQKTPIIPVKFVPMLSFL